MDPAGIPTDGTTLTEVLAALAESGYDGQFEVVSSDAVRCVTCGVTSNPDTMTTVGLRRLEGASDPDDMLAVHAVTCPACATKGVLILGFGPNAAPDEAEVGRALQDRRPFSRGSP